MKRPTILLVLVALAAAVAGHVFGLGPWGAPPPEPLAGTGETTRPVDAGPRRTEAQTGIIKSMSADPEISRALTGFRSRMQQTPAPGEVSGLGDVQLADGAVVTGTVQVDGVPAAGMSICASTEDGNHLVAKVEASGRFNLGRLPTGNAGLYLLGYMSTDWGSSLWKEHVKIRAGEDRHLHIRVQTGSLRGQVVYADGSPVAQAAWLTAEGQLDPSQKGESQPGWFRGNTDSGGRFNFPCIPCGSYLVQVGADGERAAQGQSEVVRVTAGVPTPDIRIVVTHTVPVSGSVDMSWFAQEVPHWIKLSFMPVARPPEMQFFDSALVEGDGTFRTDIVPGPYDVSIEYGGPRGAQGLVGHPEPIHVGPEGLTVVIRPRM